MGSLFPLSSVPTFVFPLLIIVCAFTFEGLTLTSAQTSCPKSLTSSNGTVRLFNNCFNLQNQGSTLSWSFQPSDSNSLGGILDVAFRTTLTGEGGWAAWGINLELERNMVGTNALIAFSASNGSNVLPYKLSAALKGSSPPALVSSPIDIEVLSSGVDIVNSLDVTIFATIRLPFNLTVINQVWNRGPGVTNFSPLAHALTSDALSAYGTLDVSSGAVTAGTVANQDLKNNHGIVNVVAWGILFPIGIMANRYVRPFTENLWFFIHVPIQVTGYIIGVAGFGTGLKLQDESGNIRYKHRNIGIVLFTLATLQMTALVLRPKPDHKLRMYWNGYHHGVGYIILVLSIVNVFEGFDILAPKKKYKHAYIGLISALAAIAAVMEIVTWVLWLRKRSRSRPERLAVSTNATNGQTTQDLKTPMYDGQL